VSWMLSSRRIDSAETTCPSRPFRSPRIECGLVCTRLVPDSISLLAFHAFGDRMPHVGHLAGGAQLQNIFPCGYGHFVSQPTNLAEPRTGRYDELSEYLSGCHFAESRHFDSMLLTNKGNQQDSNGAGRRSCEYYAVNLNKE
jgi:hypothetical protein